jgi:hypothetical protein
MRPEVPKWVECLTVDVAMPSLTGPELQDATGLTSTSGLSATGEHGALTGAVALAVRPGERVDDDRAAPPIFN